MVFPSRPSLSEGEPEDSNASRHPPEGEEEQQTSHALSSLQRELLTPSAGTLPPLSTCAKAKTHLLRRDPGTKKWHALLKGSRKQFVQSLEEDLRKVYGVGEGFKFHITEGPPGHFTFTS